MLNVKRLLSEKEYKLFVEGYENSTDSKQNEMNNAVRVERSEYLLIFHKANGRTLTYNIDNGGFV